MKNFRWTVWLLCAAILSGALSGCGASGSASSDAAGAQQAAASAKAEPLTVRTAGSYEEIRDALLSIQERSEQTEGAFSDAAATADNAAPEAASDSAATGMGGGFSDTNMQTPGVDEADIVKTDGQYLYLLRDGEVAILKADGASTAEIGKIMFGTGSSQENGYWEGNGLYLQDNTLALVLHHYSWGYNDDAGNYVNQNIDQTELLLYDVSSPSAPRLTQTFKQDGNYVASRMADGVVYLVSSYYVYDFDGDEPDPYIPWVCSDAENRMLTADEIYLCPTPGSTGYSVVTSVKLSSGERLSQQAVLGGSTGCYMSADNLYLYGSSYSQAQSDPRKEAQYTVVDCTDKTTTTLMRFSISGDAPVLEATGSVDGSLLNQFSLDETDGYLRLAATQNNNSYQIYTDEKYGFVNYRYPDKASGSSNSLFVLDSGLKQVGALTDFGQDERIYSVRFLGNTGYVTTFRETDPLFAVDLSDPANPKLLSELKITGFSSYLHPYDDHTLVGIGMEANAETGETSGLKLSMFDITDPGKVAVLNTVQMDDSSSEVLADHKAALVDKEKNLIAFPGDRRYLVYGYGADGFKLRGSFEGDDFSGSLRGLYIGENLYVCSASGVTVADLQSMNQLSHVALAFG